MKGKYSNRQLDAEGKIIPKQAIVCTLDQRVKSALDDRAEEKEQTRSACLNQLLEEVLIASSVPVAPNVEETLSRLQRLRMAARRLIGQDGNTRHRHLTPA